MRPEDTICEECGHRGLQESLEAGVRVLECPLCGGLGGDDEAVNRVLLAREAGERGFSLDLFLLVRELEACRGIRVVTAEDGDAWRGSWPRVEMEVDRKGLRQLSFLLRTLQIHRRELELSWRIELQLSPSGLLVHTLRPDFWSPPGRLTPEDLERAERDVSTLARVVSLDRGLDWWVSIS